MHRCREYAQCFSADAGSGTATRPHRMVRTHQMRRRPHHRMIVAIAAGQQPNFTFNPVESAATITSYIVSVALGDLEHGGIGYQSIFAAGLTLLVMTLLLNILGHMTRKKFAERY